MDYNEIYKQQRRRCDHQPKKKTDWDGHAQKMARDSFEGNSYTAEFLRRIDYSGCRDMLDICCGPGNLLVPSARKLEHVYGIDYSPAMLKAARDSAARLGVDNMTLFEQDRNDAWSDLPVADIVTASRCLDVPDMRAMLLKLNRQARKRIYISYRADKYYLDEKVIDVIGRKYNPRPDYMLVMNILYQCGIRAGLDFITSTGKRSFYSSVDEFVQRVEWSVPGLSEEETERISRFYDELPEENGQHVHTHSICWAFISWEKNEL